MRRLAALALGSLPLLLSPAAHASPPDDESGGSAEGSAEAEGTVSLSSRGRFEAKGKANADGEGKAKSDKWIHRWPPEAMVGELGVYGGVFFPSRRLELFQADEALPDQGFKQYRIVAPDVGLRAGFYPLSFLGIEGEGGVMPTSTLDNQNALIWTVRGHVLGQLPFWSIAPFLVAGAGALGVNSSRAAVGKEVDIELHFGGGVKFFLNRYLLLRLDVRDVLANRYGVGEGVTNNLEILLGISVVLGRKKGPEDRDGDGIPDWRDRCPDEPGPRPSGCPIKDRDHDGIEDAEDECPDDPETDNNYDDKDGCPDILPKELEDIAGVMKGIHFDVDKDTIKSESKPILEKAIETLKQFPQVNVEISGHTDSTGGYEHNMDLSRRRAASVKRYLVEGGVEESRITTNGFGPDKPIDTNDTNEGRANNRRIEFQIMTGGETVATTPSSAAPAPE
jgi:outer membrane protein OmpA-like peptidoglycan-associated protein